MLTPWMNDRSTTFARTVLTYPIKGMQYAMHVQKAEVFPPKNINLYENKGYIARHLGWYNTEQAEKLEANYADYLEVILSFLHYFILINFPQN